jgi:hypothetical protein
MWHSELFPEGPVITTKIPFQISWNQISIPLLSGQEAEELYVEIDGR